MSNINEAFNLPSQNNDNYIGYFNENLTLVKNSNTRVKVTNPSYDNLPRQKNNKFTYGYICNICNGHINYHMSIQNQKPHNFIKGNFRKLLPFEHENLYN